MDYRRGSESGECSSSDSECDEVVTKVARTLNDRNQKTLKRNQIWSDVLNEESLTSGISESINVSSSKNRCNRGAESYILPNDSRCISPKLSADKPIITVSPPCDDPFAECVDLKVVESFGVKKSDNQEFVRRAALFQKNRSDFRRRGNSRFNTHRRDNYHSNGGDRSANVTKQSHNKRKRNTAPSHLTAADYSSESLAGVEFAPGLPLNELGKQMACALGEIDHSTVVSVVEAIGEELSLRLFDETRSIELSGGMMVADKSRRRTPGGVFMTLFKCDPDVDPSIKAAIDHAQKARIIKKPKRRIQKTYDEVFQQTKESMEKAKSQHESELPTSVEALLGKSVTDDASIVKVDTSGKMECT